MMNKKLSIIKKNENSFKTEKKNDNCFNTNELKKNRMQFIIIYHDKKFYET